MTKENNNIPTGLYWQGKRTEVERISLPFQTIETINESRATREKEKDTLLKGMKEKKDPEKQQTEALKLENGVLNLSYEEMAALALQIRHGMENLDFA
ncbi:MAG: hypothetical protein AB1480_01550 [Nitrospirota bacterium]